MLHRDPTLNMELDHDTLSRVPGFTDMTSNEIYHHLGFTTAILPGILHANYQDVKAAIP